MNGYGSKGEVNIQVNYSPKNFGELKEIFFLLGLAQRPAKPVNPMVNIPPRQNAKALDDAYAEYRRKGGSLPHDPWQEKYLEFISLEVFGNESRYDQLASQLLINKEA